MWFKGQLWKGSEDAPLQFSGIYLRTGSVQVVLSLDTVYVDRSSWGPGLNRKVVCKYRCPEEEKCPQRDVRVEVKSHHQRFRGEGHDGSWEWRASRVSTAENRARSWFAEAESRLFEKSDS